MQGMGLRTTNTQVATDDTVDPSGTRVGVHLRAVLVAVAASVADRIYHREGINMKSGIRNMARGAAVVAVLTMLTACSGGDSAPATYTISASASRQRVIDSLPSLLPGERTCIC
jgi:hypothetical protein